MSGGLNHRVSRNAGGAQWTWKKVIVVVDSGAAENVMQRSLFPEISTKEAQRSKNGKGFKGRGGEHIKNNGQQVMSVRTLDGFCTQEHVAGCRGKTSGASISHHSSRERAVHREE